MKKALHKQRELRLQEVTNLLHERCIEAGSQRAFAAEHNFNRQYVSQVLMGLRPPSARLCEVLGIEPDGSRWVKR